MGQFKFTLKGNIEADNFDEAWLEWEALLSNPNFVEDGTVVIEESDDDEEA